MPYRLSKSKILSGRQCPKRLYLELHEPELIEESPATDHVKWWGFEVLKVARVLNQDGILVGHDYDLKQAFTQPQELLECGTHPLVFSISRTSAVSRFPWSRRSKPRPNCPIAQCELDCGTEH
jgi:hypothetical protein